MENMHEWSLTKLLVYACRTAPDHHVDAQSDAVRHA